MYAEHWGASLQIPEPEPEPVKEGLSAEELTEMLEKANAEVSPRLCTTAYAQFWHDCTPTTRRRYTT